MNKSVGFAISLLFLSLVSAAQEKKVYNTYQIYPGYIIGLANDTTWGFVENGDRDRNQTKVFSTPIQKMLKLKKLTSLQN